jgi:hypothetical protein
VKFELLNFKPNGVHTVYGEFQASLNQIEALGEKKFDMVKD